MAMDLTVFLTRFNSYLVLYLAVLNRMEIGPL